MCPKQGRDSLRGEARYAFGEEEGSLLSMRKYLKSKKPKGGGKEAGHG